MFSVNYSPIPYKILAIYPRQDYASYIYLFNSPKDRACTRVLLLKITKKTNFNGKQTNTKQKNKHKTKNKDNTTNNVYKT